MLNEQPPVAFCSFPNYQIIETFQKYFVVNVILQQENGKVFVLQDEIACL